MSVRFDATTDVYTSTLSLGTIPHYTISCWVRIAVDRDNFSSVWDFGAGGQGLLTESDGTTMKVWDDVLGTFIATGPAMTVGKDYFFAVSVSGSDGKLYWRAHDEARLSSASFTGAARPLNSLKVGNNNFDEWFNGAVLGLRIYTVGLTAEEALAESRQQAPRRQRNLEAWWPLIAGDTAGTQEIGHGRTLTAGSTATTSEASPSLPWRLAEPPHPVKPAAASGTDATATPAVITCTTALPAVGANIQAGPSAITATTALPVAAPLAVTLTAPATIATTTAIGQPGVNTAAQPGTIAPTAALPRPAANITAGPAATATTATLPQATVQAGGNITATPSAITCITVITAPGINVGSGPGVITVTITLPAPTTGATAKATSTPTVTAPNTSTATVAAAITSASTVSATVTSTSTVA